MYHKEIPTMSLIELYLCFILLIIKPTTITDVCNVIISLAIIAILHFKGSKFIADHILTWYSPDVVFNKKFIEKSPGIPITNYRLRKRIAITIDDAPYIYNNYECATWKILKVLKYYNVQCTFFCIGEYAKQRLNIIGKMRKDGHEIGNHGFNEKLSLGLTKTEFIKKLLETEKILSIDNNNGPKLFRPGSGFYSKRMIQWLKDYNYKLILGNVYPQDAHIESSWHSSTFVNMNISDGDIVILHDRSWTPRALDDILSYCQDNDIEVCTVSKLLNGIREFHKTE